MDRKGFTMRRFLICTVNIARAIKSRRFIWTGHLARMEEGRSAYKILTGKPTGKGLGVDGRTILDGP